MAILALSNLTHNNHNNCRYYKKFNIDETILTKLICLSEILSYQGIETVVKLVKDEKDTTKAYACVCLTNMSFDEVIRQEITQTIFVPTLCVALCAKYLP